jgi:hypothetical protein
MWSEVGLENLAGGGYAYSEDVDDVARALFSCEVDTILVHSVLYSG